MSYNGVLTPSLEKNWYTDASTIKNFDSYLNPTNSSQSGIRFHLCTVSNGPKSRVRETADSGQLWSKSIFEKVSAILSDILLQYLVKQVSEMRKNKSNVLGKFYQTKRLLPSFHENSKLWLQKQFWVSSDCISFKYFPVIRHIQRVNNDQN